MSNDDRRQIANPRRRDPELERMRRKMDAMLRLGRDRELVHIMARHSAVSTASVPLKQRAAWMAEVDEVLSKAQLH